MLISCLSDFVLNSALGISAANLDVRWQRSFRGEDKLPQEATERTMALSAFLLTTLPTPLAQRALVEEMWASGAHTIVLIDHDTPEGFKAVAHAREHILEMSRSQSGDSEAASGGTLNCHVLAPVSINEGNHRRWISLITT